MKFHNIDVAIALLILFYVGVTAFNLLQSPVIFVFERIALALISILLFLRIISYRSDEHEELQPFVLALIISALFALLAYLAITSILIKILCISLSAIYLICYLQLESRRYQYVPYLLVLSYLTMFAYGVGGVKYIGALCYLILNIVFPGAFVAYHIKNQLSQSLNDLILSGSIIGIAFQITGWYVFGVTYLLPGYLILWANTLIMLTLGFYLYTRKQHRSWREKSVLQE